MTSFKSRAGLIVGVATLMFALATGSSTAHGCELRDFSPEGIKEFLQSNSIDNAAKFVACLPAEYKENWIMMSYSLSTQKGTAEFPRFLLSSMDSTKVFGIELPSNPDANDPNLIEYIQFDGDNNEF